MLVWPAALLPPETEGWRLTAVAISGGVSAGGTSSLARTDGGGLWTCAMTNIEIHTPGQLHTAEALDLQLEAGVTKIIVPRFCHHLAPVPEGVVLRPTSTHSDGTTFSDDAEYEGAAILGALAENAALRATTLQVEFTAVGPLLGGEPFSIVHPVRGKRLYGIHSVGDTVDGVTTFTIRPPLREAAPAGTVLDFDNPGCVMRLVNPDWLSPLDPSHERTGAPTWVEAF